MNRFLSYQSLIYKSLLVLVSAVLIVYLLPKLGKFKYEFQKGMPWNYETLIAPFDFPILKSSEDLEIEKVELLKKLPTYYKRDPLVVEQVKTEVEKALNNSINDSILHYFPGLLTHALDAIDLFYKQPIFPEGILPQSVNFSVVEGVLETLISADSIVRTSSFTQNFHSEEPLKSVLLPLIEPHILPNVAFDQILNTQARTAALQNLSNSRGMVVKGVRIIARGEVVEGEKWQILQSLKTEYESQLWDESNYNWILLGYSVLIGLVLVMLLLFLHTYRPKIYENNNKVSFIVANMVLMVLLTTLVVKYDASYVYVVPLCSMPLILKAFFDARLGLFVHVLTLLILGFVVPNSFEYIFLQLIAGVVTILTVSELHKRANLFISVAQITAIYIVGYLAFSVIHEGHPDGIEWMVLGYFALNGLATLFVQPLIYLYEKIFGLVSDVSLLELLDTNTSLLRELSDKAPGTFHHSLQVANLAEAAANEIGANAMLVRVGALYHDIGKLDNPTYFTENQKSSYTPHNDLEPLESTQLIIRHIKNGILLARKHKIPDRVIDFIRTHHGTTTVYYFFKQAQEASESTNENDFRYPGPKPFSKETSILMMADAVEAASRSIQDPTASQLDEFVERIVDKQMEDGQFLEANITLLEIQMVKKVLKQKIKTNFHLRVSYPE